MEEFLDLDKWLLLKLNGSGSPLMDGYIWMCTDKWMWLPLALVFFYSIARNNSLSRTVLIIVLMALLITTSDQISSSLLKPLTHRLRPTHDAVLGQVVNTVLDYRGGLYSFPSSHATNSFAVFAFTALLVRHWGYTLCMLLWAGVIAYSRVYLGVHYPSDVLTGALLGAFLGWAYYRAYGALHHKWIEKSEKNVELAFFPGGAGRRADPVYPSCDVYGFIAVYIALNLLAAGLGYLIMDSGR